MIFNPTPIISMMTAVNTTTLLNKNKPKDKKKNDKETEEEQWLRQLEQVLKSHPS